MPTEAAARAADMAALDLPEMVAATDDELLARVRVVTDSIAEHQEIVDNGYAERLNLYRVLSARGVPQRTIGDSARTSANAVGYALHRHGRDVEP